MNKILVMIYDGFSMYEINALTSIFAWSPSSAWPITVVAAEHKLYRTEDGFQVLPDSTFGQIGDIHDYRMLILPGIADYHTVLPVQRNIDFLKRFRTRPRPLIAAISAAPILLAKAGLLDDTKFMTGLFESTYAEESFIPKQNLVRKPVVVDHGIITSTAFYPREFAIAAAHELGIGVPDNVFAPYAADATADELTFRDAEN